MKVLAAASVLMLTAACAHAADIQHLGRTAAAPFPCDVEVSFGSACCGIDRPALAAVEKIVQGRAGVSKAAERATGREGEVELCVATTSAAAADGLFEDLARLRFQPANSSYTTISRGEKRVRLEAR